MTDLLTLPIADLAARIARRELSPVDLVEASLARIEQLNPTLNAFISVRADKALDEARAAEQAIAKSGPLSPLHGIPIAVKDNIDVAGEVTTAGSASLRDNAAAEDAEVVSRLKKAGAIIIGKTNLHEFAQGATTINPHFGPARNPWDHTLSPGGSSGGSAAAVSAGMVPAALGTDTGGSVRLPAAFCNLTGVRPPSGLIATLGVFPVSHTLDTVGPIARSVQDCWLILSVLAEIQIPPAWSNSQRSIRLGIPQDSFFWSRADLATVQVFEDWVFQLVGRGAIQVDIDVPGVADASRAAGIISLMESVEVHRERLNTPEVFGEDVRRMLTRGLSHTPDDLASARQTERSWSLELDQLFEKVDVIATPTCPVFPPSIDQPDREIVKNLLSFTFPFSLGGYPSLSLPGGFSPANLPVGFQLIARDLDLLLLAASTFQSFTNYSSRRPN